MPDISSMQGVVTERSPAQRVTVVPIKGMIAPPEVKDIAAGASLAITNADLRKYGMDYIGVQNVGLAALMFAYNCDAAPGLYHGILAACVALEDGLGSVIGIDKMYVEKLTIYNNSAVTGRVCMLKVMNPAQPNHL